MEVSYATTSNVDVVSVASGDRPVKVLPLVHPSPSSSRRPSAPFLGRWVSMLREMSSREWTEIFLPCARWIRSYRWREYLQADLIAGVTVGIMLVPQSMSYAKLAGLHPIYGLYSSFVPIFIYSIFGSSRQLAIGPVALVSLLVSNVLHKIVDSSEKLYTELAILLAFMVGVLECLMGLFRLGWLIRFVSHSVISGFTTASALVIALSQAKYFLGYNIEGSSKIVPLIRSIIAGAGDFKWPPFVMGFFILGILLLMKELGKTKKNLRMLRASGPLTAVILGTSFVKIFHPSSISVVGDVPQGLPKFSVPTEFRNAKSLIPTAFLITGVAIMESVGIAKALAAKHGYELDSNQELFGLGVANICGSFFSSYPTTGSFSRSAVNHESGAKTGLSGITMGIIMGCALLFMTPLFRDIPQCALAAIVVSAVMGLVEHKEAIFLWRVDKRDFFLWIVTCITTLVFGIEIGVLIGVAFSLAFVIHESANPHVAVTYVDSSAIQALKELHQEYKSRGIQILIANPSREVHLSLFKSGLLDILGKEWCFVRVHDAVQICLQRVQKLHGLVSHNSDQTPRKQYSFLQSLWKQGEETNSYSEPLLSEKDV
ncbi:sulfate transporter 4.1, chloroplastic-like isoform X1 [Phalaenopsis equestris]|uniref:sulfate transporter 4.1, chloroplastic-like isoform X1 n=1 Tax=Phalaenopsis equestris TaxID=78828 RepID=UPI0009E2E62D|nr:sulfate transporter 4.1, chloroplastic-like isoform X1 [Phalaenopsis equestris]